MKKQGFFPTILCCVLFLGLLTGLFLWRNMGKDPILISALPRETQESTNRETLPERININTADIALLDTLPGIGPALAARIVTYREEHGPFTVVSQLTMVSGIGVEKLNGLIDYVTVGG